MTEAPQQIPGSVHLQTGDRLPVTAFLTTTSAEGWHTYSVRCEDGSPLDLGPDDVTGVSLEMLPGRSSAVIQCRGPKRRGRRGRVRQFARRWLRTGREETSG